MDFSAGDFTPVIVWIALDSNVLVAARSRIEGAWAAYIGSVPGMNHVREVSHVLQNGTKLPEHIARTIFQHKPELMKLPYAP